MYAAFTASSTRWARPSNATARTEASSSAPSQTCDNPAVSIGLRPVAISSTDVRSSSNFEACGASVGLAVTLFSM
jgi:hypothetical protein